MLESAIETIVVPLRALERSLAAPRHAGVAAAVAAAPKTLGTVSPSAANITPRRYRSRGQAGAAGAARRCREDGGGAVRRRGGRRAVQPGARALDARARARRRVLRQGAGAGAADVAEGRRRGEAQVLACPKGERSVSLGKRGFRYDNVLDGQSTQAEVFGELSDQVSGFAGYNSTVLAYGQTGSGKTFTCGSSGFSVEPEDEGILPRLFTRSSTTWSRSASSRPLRSPSSRSTSRPAATCSPRGGRPSLDPAERSRRD